MDEIEIIVGVYASFALLTTATALFVLCFISRCRLSALLAFITGMAVLAPVPTVMLLGGDCWDVVFFAVLFIVLAGPILAAYQMLGALVMFVDLFRHASEGPRKNGGMR